MIAKIIIDEFGNSPCVLSTAVHKRWEHILCAQEAAVLDTKLNRER